MSWTDSNDTSWMGYNVLLPHDRYESRFIHKHANFISVICRQIQYHLPRGHGSDYVCQTLCSTLDLGLKSHVHKYVNQKRLRCHAGCQEVGCCHTRGESEKSDQVRDLRWL